MNSPDPVPTKPSYVPSGSTNATALGAFLASILAWYLGKKGIYMDAGVESAFCGVFAIIAGYLPPSGRK